MYICSGGNVIQFVVEQFDNPSHDHSNRLIDRTSQLLNIVLCPHASSHHSQALGRHLILFLI